MATLDRQWVLPAGFDAQGRMISLEQALSPEAAPLAAEVLTTEQRVALVRARWEAGEWDDVLLCDEFVDLPRAIREVEGQTEMGRELLRAGERALSMVMEDARQARMR